LDLLAFERNIAKNQIKAKISRNSLIFFSISIKKRGKTYKNFGYAEFSIMRPIPKIVSSNLALKKVWLPLIYIFL